MIDSNVIVEKHVTIGNHLPPFSTWTGSISAYTSTPETDVMPKDVVAFSCKAVVVWKPTWTHGSKINGTRTRPSAIQCRAPTSSVRNQIYTDKSGSRPYADSFSRNFWRVET